MDKEPAVALWYTQYKRMLHGQRLHFIAVILCFLTTVRGQDNIKAVACGFVCPPCNRKCDELCFEKAGVCEHCNMELIPKEKLKDIPNIMRTKVGLYLQSGVEILDVAGPMEVFSYAGYEVFTISKKKEPIYAQGILTVTPDYGINDAPEADILVFFGGNAVLPSKDEELIDWVKSRKDTKYFFSVCSGVLILAEAGILDHQKATTFRYTLDVLEENFPDVEVLRGVRYVDNGNSITTAGVSAGIDGALHMVAKLEGLPTAANTAFYMEYDWTPNKGVVFSKDNPYSHMNDTTVLSEYEGWFVSPNGNRIQLKVDEKKKCLNLINSGGQHELFFIEKDRFLSSESSNFVEFSRYDNNQIEHFTTTEGNTIFKKQ